MEFAIYGDEQDGILLANAGDWDDAGAREAFRVAVVREVDRTIVTPCAILDAGGGSVPQAEHYRPLTVVWDRWAYPPRLACCRSGGIRSARALRSSAGFSAYAYRLSLSTVSIMAFARASPSWIGSGR
jgi:hypothetical protein